MQEVSIRGRVIRDMIAHFSNDNLIGQKIKSGEFRKKLVEPKWRCPGCFSVENVSLPNFPMEFLRSRESPRQDYVILQRNAVLRNPNMAAATLAPCAMPTVLLPGCTVGPAKAWAF